MKFKVGDKVRVIGASAGWDTINRGDVGSISKVFGSGDLHEYLVD